MAESYKIFINQKKLLADSKFGAVGSTCANMNCISITVGLYAQKIYILTFPDASAIPLAARLQKAGMPAGSGQDKRD